MRWTPRPPSLNEWEGGLLKEGNGGRQGQGAGGWGSARGKHFVLCVNIGDLRPAHAQTDCPSASQPHLSSCPQVPFDVHSPGARSLPQWIQAARPRPRQRHRQDKEHGRLVPARPQEATRLSLAGREEEISDLALGHSFLLGCWMAAGCWGRGARRPYQPREDEGRGKAAVG